MDPGLAEALAAIERERIENADAVIKDLGAMAQGRRRLLRSSEVPDSRRTR